MMSMLRPRYFAVVSRHEKVPTAPHINAMPTSRARRALAASRACTADSVFMCVAACRGKSSLPRGKSKCGSFRQVASERNRPFCTHGGYAAACAGTIARLPLARERAFVPAAQQEIGNKRQCEEDRDS